jgi:hypothetical protein
MNEMRFSDSGTEYIIKKEVEKYQGELNTTIVSICRKVENDTVPVYKLYDFKYEDILTQKFINRSVISKNVLLFLLILRKAPKFFIRNTQRRGFNHPFLALYIWAIFLTLSIVVISLLPATFSIIAVFLINQLKQTDLSNGFENFAKYLTSIMSSLLILIPGGSNFVTRLATEYICVNDYIEFGARSQLVLGNLEFLLEFITERETDCEVHIHSYSFGSIVAIDFLFPFGGQLSNNIQKYVKGLITIGSPFEFFNAYYPHYFTSRNSVMAGKLKWINIYSRYDALASNFRKDSKVGEATETLPGTDIKPVNRNYEVTNLGNLGIYEFIFLKSVSMHASYWDDDPVGRSCLSDIHETMKEFKQI